MGSPSYKQCPTKTNCTDYTTVNTYTLQFKRLRVENHPRIPCSPRRLPQQLWRATRVSQSHSGLQLLPLLLLLAVILVVLVLLLLMPAGNDRWTSKSSQIRGDVRTTTGERKESCDPAVAAAAGASAPSNSDPFSGFVASE